MIPGLSKATNPLDIINAWNELGDESKNSKAIISLNDYDKDAFPQNLTDLIKVEGTDFVSYFSSSKLYFVDDELLREILFSESKNAAFHIDYSIMFDTNYASYIHRFVNNDMFDFNNDIFNTIATLIRNEFRYDYIFYLIENTKNIDSDSILSMQDFKIKYADIYSNIISLEVFKSIDSEYFKNSGRIRYTVSREEAARNVDHLIEDIFLGDNGRNGREHFLFTRKIMTLFLIGMLQINFKSKKSAAKKTAELFDYMQTTVGMYLDREAIIAYKYFKNPGSLRMFNKIQKGGKLDTYLEIIENISWDFVAPRIMEYYLQYEGEGRYFLPFFLSHDKGLKEILNLFSIKAVFLSESRGALSLPEITTREFLENEGCKVDLDLYFSDEIKNNRASVLENNRKLIDHKIATEYKKLMEILSE